MTRQCKMCLWCFECYFHPDFQLSGWYVNDLNINIGTCMLTNAGSLAQLIPPAIEYPCSIDLCFYLHLYFLCLESRIAKLILYICIKLRDINIHFHIGKNFIPRISLRKWLAFISIFYVTEIGFCSQAKWYNHGHEIQPHGPGPTDYDVT